MNYILVGDIHSQFSNFERAVSFVQENFKEHHLILLGDAFDSRCDQSNSVEVYKLIRTLQNENRATIIHSNHQWKLQRHLYGNPIVADASLQKTIADFENSEVDSQELLEWLESLPYAIAFKDCNNTEYRCAHAYFSSKLFVPLNYSGIYKINIVSKVSFRKSIYGLLNRENKRVCWWEEKSNHDWIRCSGHYHRVIISYENRSIVLDSCCGDDNGKLSIFDVNSRQMYQF